MSFREKPIPLTVLPGNKFLCGRSEDRLFDAVGSNGIILVEDTLLVKFKGEMVGLALNTRRTKNGIIQTVRRGHWYYPEKATRTRIREGFTKGLPNIELSNSRWWYGRRAEPIDVYTYPRLTPQELLDLADKAAERLSTTPRETSEEEREQYMKDHLFGY